MFILAELRLKWFLDNILFLSGFYGKGMFFILYELFSVGALSFDFDGFSVVVSLILVVTGLLYACFQKKLIKKQPPKSTELPNVA